MSWRSCVSSAGLAGFAGFAASEVAGAPAAAAVRFSVAAGFDARVSVAFGLWT